MGLIRPIALMLAILLLAGCTPVYNYSNCTIPATLNSCRDNCKTLQQSNSSCTYFEWNSDFVTENRTVLINGTNQSTLVKREVACHCWLTCDNKPINVYLAMQ